MSEAKLADKVVLVTGAGRGAGAAAASASARSGATVVLTDAEPLDLGRTAAIVGRGGGACLQRRCDLARVEDVRALLEVVVAECGRLDGVANCAELRAKTVPLEFLSEDLWDAQLTGSLKTTFLLCREAIPVLRRGGGGSIVNLGVARDERGLLRRGARAVAGFAVEGLTQVLAEELAADAIRVNAVTPPLDLDGKGEAPAGPTPARVAAAIVHLLSDAARDVTGQCLDPARWGPS